MNAPLARLDGTSPDIGSNRRRQPRFTTWHEAFVHARQDPPQDVLLTDVSTHGCCLRGDSLDIKVGSIISVRIGEHPALPGMVRWLRDGSAGIEFLRPISHERQEWHYLMDMPY